MFHFASKGGYYLSAAFIQERPLIEHIRYIDHLMFTGSVCVCSCSPSLPVHCCVLLDAV